ncbi:hypothetical protein [Streptantibioticus silvisoli]|uniref:Ig-like domain repeat protein n=1 Tax=Streptantibioticus silvisoli TaxID=2705255 RepID=A0ABT6VYA8_9ACTN|nr:hypothetical protein [Streptantibioticus silvisoli]MDI5963470.1 hypothetical protein [Streptantibioticus silvisoli]
MAIRRAALASAVTLVAGIVTAGLPTAQASAADSTALPGTSVTQALVDDAAGHLFLRQDGDLLVTDLTGAELATLPEPGTGGIALSADGSTVYVARGDDGRIAAVDTATLTRTALYATGTGTAPTAVAVSGGRVWFTYTGADGGGIGSLDPAPGGTASPAVLTPVAGAQDPQTSPAAPGTLVTSAAPDGSPEAAVYDISTGVPRLTASAPGDPGPLEIAPDGKHVFSAGDGVLDLSDLSRDGRYYPTFPAGDDSRFALAADGTLAYTADDTAVHTAGPVTPEELRRYPGQGTTALAWAPDDSAVYRFYDDGGPHLETLDGPELGDTYVSFGAPATAPATDRAITLPVSVCGVNAFGVGESVHVVRTGPGDPGTTLPALTATGSEDDNGFHCLAFTLSDDVPLPGAWQYAVTYDGDPAHTGSTGQDTVTVGPSTPRVTLTAPRTAARGAAVHLTGTLDHPPYAAGSVVHVIKTNLAHPDGYPLPDAKVGVDGTFSVTDTVPTGGPTTYTASFAGDAGRNPAAGTATVQVSRLTPQLSITTDRSSYANGSTATVTAHLGTTYNGRSVEIYAHPYGGATTLIHSGTVDAHGDLTVRYHLPHSSTFSARFPGDYRYAPATADRNAPVYVGITETLTGSYGATTINGHTYRLYHVGSPIGLTAAVTPAKPGEQVSCTVQEWEQGAWLMVSGTSAAELSASSTHRFTLGTGSWSGPTSLRIRVSYARTTDDDTNLDTDGGWVYLQLR